MPNLDSLIPSTTNANALGVVLVLPQAQVGYQPQNKPVKNGQVAQQPPRFLFNYEGEQTAQTECDITDHFVEDNTAIQDQISLKPIRVTTHGYIGEVNNVVPIGLESLKIIADKMTTLSAYTPELSVTAQLAYNQAFQSYQQAESLVNSAISAWDTINGGNSANQITGSENVSQLSGLINSTRNQSRQQIAYQFFYAYQQNRNLFTVQTPWAIFKNMAIQSLRAVQTDETNTVTDFEITFKQIRFAETITINAPIEGSYDYNNFQGRTYNQGEPIVDIGTSTPVNTLSLDEVIA